MKDRELKKQAAKILLKEEEKKAEKEQPGDYVKAIKQGQEWYVNAKDLLHVLYRKKSGFDDIIISKTFQDANQEQQFRGAAKLLKEIAEFLEGFYRDEKSRA